MYIRFRIKDKGLQTSHSQQEQPRGYIHTRWLLGLVLACACALIHAQVIHTIAGGATGDGGPAIGAQLNFPHDVAADSAGNVYIADTSNNRIRKLATNGTITTVAGNGSSGFSGDGGAATSAALVFPEGMYADASGNLYIADSGNHRIRKLATDGTITTVAGNGTVGYSGDGGPATSAAIALPRKVIVDDASGAMYIIDGSNAVIRKVSTNGTITTIAGNGTYGYSGDGGPATNAQLADLEGLAIDAAGNLYISDNFNSVGRIRRIATDGIITTVAGGGAGGLGDGGPATSAKLTHPTGLTIDATDNLFIADMYASRVRRVAPDGTITTVAGDGSYGYTGDGGLATDASLASPTGVAVDPAGNLYVIDVAVSVVRKVASDGGITTVAGSNYSGDAGPATDAALYSPSGVTVDGIGNTYIADTSNNRIRKLAPNGTITTIAGNGAHGYAGDGGPATSAALSYPESVAIDQAGNLYIAAGSSVRKVAPDGSISTFAGSGSEKGYSGDGGPATSAKLASPGGVSVDMAGHIYIADTVNNRIRMVDASGTITTVAGNGTAGYSGDDGAATSAQLNYPRDVSVDITGSIYIADTLNNRVRKLDSSGTITTVAGNGSYGSSGDGDPATNAELARPRGVAVDTLGKLYIADAENQRIRLVGLDGIIMTVAGNGKAGYAGDGSLATDAQLNSPHQVAVDTAGDIYIADRNNNRIRKVSPDEIFKDGFEWP